MAAAAWRLDGFRRRLADGCGAGGGRRIVPKMNFCFGHEYPCPLDLCCTQPRVQGDREIDPHPLVRSSGCSAHREIPPGPRYKLC